MQNIKSHSTVVFLQNYDYSPVSTTMFKTNITEQKSGTEKRNIEWRQPLTTLDINFSVRSKELIDYIIKFFNSMYGAGISFPIKNWIECYTFKEDGVINVDNDFKLDGYPTCQLFKKYQVDINNGGTFRKISIIAKPEDEKQPAEYLPFSLYKNGVIADFAYTLDYENATLYLPLVSSSDVTAVNQTTSVFTTSSNHNFIVGDLIYFDSFTQNSVLNNRVFKINQIVSPTQFKIEIPLTGVTIGVNGKAKKYYQDQSVTINWQGEFLMKVRFFDDQSPITYDTFGSLSVPIKLKEIL